MTRHTVDTPGHFVMPPFTRSGEIFRDDQKGGLTGLKQDAVLGVVSVGLGQGLSRHRAECRGADPALADQGMCLLDIGSKCVTEADDAQGGGNWADRIGW